MASKLLEMASNLAAMASNLEAMASNLEARASNLEAMASNLIAMASKLLAMASNLPAMASNLLAMASNLEAMASNLIAMASSCLSVIQAEAQIAVPAFGDPRKSNCGAHLLLDFDPQNQASLGCSCSLRAQKTLARPDNWVMHASIRVLIFSSRIEPKKVNPPRQPSLS